MADTISAFVSKLKDFSFLHPLPSSNFAAKYSKLDDLSVKVRQSDDSINRAVGGYLSGHAEPSIPKAHPEKRGILLDISNKNKVMDDHLSSKLQNTGKLPPVNVNLKRSDQSVYQGIGRKGLGDSIDRLEDLLVSSLTIKDPSSVADNTSVVPIREIVYDRELEEYVDEIFDHLKDLEIRYRPEWNHLAVQREVSIDMRDGVVDWLIEVADGMGLCQDTLHLAVNYIDRFLSKCRITADRLECLAITALFTASKYEEVSPCTLSEAVQLLDNYFTGTDIIMMEKKLLKVLSFSLDVATTQSFNERFCKAAGADDKVMLLVSYLTDMALVDYNMLRYLPSEISAAAVVIALHTCQRRTVWDTSLSHYTGYSYASLRRPIQDLFDMYRFSPYSAKYQGVRKKYASSRFMSVGSISPPKFLPSKQLE
ncbi:cyclin-like protein [Paraphysoderma sedebokerense]|nr:cyclin-like protein [Paraphysoderma sedebokerense]